MDITEIEILMKSLVLSCPSGLTIQQLDKDFKSEVGNSIPFKSLGYVSLESMISSLHKTFDLVRKDGKTYVQAKSSNKTKHIECMIAAQKKKRIRPPRRNKFIRFSYRETNFPKTIKNAVNSNETFGNWQPTNDSNLIKYNNIPDKHNSEKFVENYKNRDRSCKLYPECFNKTETVVYKSIFGGGYIENKNNLKKVQFNDSKNENYPLHPSTSFSDYLNNHCEKSYPILQVAKQYNFSDYMNQQFNSKENVISPQNNFSDFMNQQFNNKENVISPQNLNIKNLEESVNEFLNQKSDAIDNNVISSKTLNIKTLEESVNYLLNDKPNIIENNIISSKTLNIKSLEESVNDLQQFFIKQELNFLKEKNLKFVADFPLFVALLGDEIPIPEEIEYIPIGAQFCIYISEIHNPYKFWFHMEKKSDLLDELMYKLELFYKKMESEEFNMHILNIKPKQLCAAMFNNDWHRAEILQVPVNDLVKVYFLDYGTVDYVPITSIKYLHKDFIQMPSQVYRGCFSYVKPVNIRWDRDCSYFLLSMIFEKKLWVKLDNYDEIDKIYHITILDTSTEVDINLNALLVNEGFADLFNDSNKVSMHFQYLYPTFDMLENGEYPSFKEIGSMLAYGYDYENEEYKSLKSINSKRLYGFSTLEFWNFIKTY